MPQNIILRLHGLPTGFKVDVCDGKGSVMMRRLQIILMALSIVCCPLLSACAESPSSDITESDTFAVVSTLNQNSSFGEYELLQLYDGPGTFSNPNRGNQNANSLPADNLPQPADVFGDGGERLLSAYYGFFPWGSDTLVVTEINLKGEGFHVFGLSVGDELSGAVQTLHDAGYVEQKAEGAYSYFYSSLSDKKTIMRNGEVIVVLSSYKSNAVVLGIVVRVWNGTEDTNSDTIY